MEGRKISYSRVFSFPSTHEEIEIVVYKNQDGTFKNSEALMPPLKKAFSEINDLISRFYELKEENAYVLRVLSSTKAKILEFKFLSGLNRIDYASENLVYDLTNDELDQIKSIVISSVTIFLELFAHYYATKLDRRIQIANDVNEELLLLLRFSNGAKIKFLEELLGLYVVLDGQTYFDVIGHIIMSGAYTFGSLFSVTGLYHAANSTLIGKGMLHGASRRSFEDNSESRDKGEIHTVQGLAILYLRQFRLKTKKLKNVRSDVKYESISITDEDVPVQKSTTETFSMSNLKRTYEQVKDFKVLSLEGLNQLASYREELVNILNEPDFTTVIGKIRSCNLSSVSVILQTFDHPRFEPLLERIDRCLNHKYEQKIYERVISVDFLSLGKYRMIVEKNFLRFLAFIESPPVEADLTDSIIQRFLNTTEPTTVILECLAEFLEVIS